MPGENAFLVSSCGQVHAGVPAKKKRKIVLELDCKRRIKWAEAGLGQQSVEPRADPIGVFTHAENSLLGLMLVLAHGIFNLPGLPFLGFGYKGCEDGRS